MNTTHTINGRAWTAVLGDTYTDRSGVERRKAGHMSLTIAEPITSGDGERARKTGGLTVNVCPTWGHGRAIAMRGDVETGGQVRCSVADDVVQLIEVLRDDIPHILGNWSTYGLDAIRLTPEPTAPAQPAPAPTVDANAALAALLTPATAPDPWDAVRAQGASEDVIAALIAADITPAAALATLTA